jgi:hypothetical protein
METKEKKVYLSNLKQIGQTTGLKGRIYADKTSEHWQTDEKGRKYLPFSIWQNREPDQYGNTHAMILDTWKPDPSKKNTSDLPF